MEYECSAAKELDAIAYDAWVENKNTEENDDDGR